MKTIEGIITDFENGPEYELGNGAGFCDFWEGSNEDGIHALLCISEDGTPPKVMAVEEVEKMLKEILEYKRMTLARPVNLVWEQDIRSIAAKYGVTLNP